MRHGDDAEFFDQIRQRHVGERLPAWTAEHQAKAGTPEQFAKFTEGARRLPPPALLHESELAARG